MWGANPFTNYQQMPYSSGPQSFSMGQGGYGNPSMNGQFNPGALDFSSGSMSGPLSSMYGAMQGFGGGSSGSGGMPSWGGQGQGSMGGGMLGASPWQSQGQSPWMQGGMGRGMGGMPPWMQGGGMNPASRGFQPWQGRQTMPYSTQPQPVQPAAQAADPNGMNGIYGNVVHNGQFDSAGGGVFGPATRSLLGLS